MDGYENAITVVEPEPYYSHVLNLENGSPAPSQKEVAGENGCGLSVRREGLVAAGYWDSLRTHLSDPMTGALMDDAMILPCGHSFGSSGMQHVYRMVIAGVNPHEKKKFISKLQGDQKVVAMVGDGINDAAALASSDIGIAMGEGVGAASNVSSVVLMGNRLPQPNRTHFLLILRTALIRSRVNATMMDLFS